MKFKLIMIYKEDCYYCKISKPIIKEFISNNSHLIDVEYIDLYDYKEQFGKISSVPQFYIINNINKTIQQFDFYDNISESRTYNKLVQTLNLFINQ